MQPKRIVHRVEDGMDRQSILCTTYQMRNFYRQLGDGFFTSLDIMNYIQHHQIVRWCKKGDQVLDVCCGRGLLLPMLRYQRKEIAGYTGVDIAPKNATWLSKRVTNGKPVSPNTYYPFPTTFVEANVASMAEKLSPPYDAIVYTSSIEHMHKSDGEKSIEQVRRVSRPGTRLYLTCPNTPEGQDGYDTQYRAHVYEWKRSEIIAVLQHNGFKLDHEWGLLLGKRELKNAMALAGMTEVFDRLDRVIPTEWLVPVLSSMFPEKSKEIGFAAVAI